MDETRSPAPSGATRRGFLVAGAVGVVGGAGSGVLLGRSTGTPDPDPLIARVSTELAGAARAERALIAGVDAQLKAARGARRRALREIRAGHIAHLQAIEGAIDVAVYPATRSSSSPAPSVRAATVSLQVAEQRAAKAAAARALRLSGGEATLLATIAAAEATHAVLLGGGA